MNFLAHAYLSFNEPKILVGNFIGDFVRGNIEERFEKEIVQGILLHREIDQFTDSHSEVKRAQKVLKPQFGRYALVITDIYFDHFLCKYWNQYDERPVEVFSRQVYAIIEKNREVLPEKFLHMFTYMREQNWLTSYGTLDGIGTAFRNMAKRASFDSKMEFAHLALKENYATFKESFDGFFPELVDFSFQKLKALKSET